MNKQDFLGNLKNALGGLPQNDIEERLAFYSEMIDDLLEEGKTEEEAIESIGSVNDIVSQTVSDVPLTKIVKENIKPKRTLKAWEITLIILGFPLWFPILIAAACVLLSLYIAVWAIIGSLWGIEFSLFASAIVSFASAAVFVFRGQMLTGSAVLACSLILTGLSILMFFVCLAACKGVIYLTKKSAFLVKNMFVKGGNTK